MNLKDYDIGYSELTGKIYLGKSKQINDLGHREWIDKKDITQRFYNVMNQVVKNKSCYNCKHMSVKQGYNVCTRKCFGFYGEGVCGNISIFEKDFCCNKWESL